MSFISLLASTRTCKIDQAWANRIQSDRFENPELMVCPVWTGFDNANRAVCADSYYTKTAGCNSALDRVDVENALRPKYMEYINLDAEGFQQPSGDIVNGPAEKYTESCSNDNTNMNCRNSGVRTIGLENIPTITGNFGQSPSGAEVYPSCSYNSYGRAQRQENTAARMLRG